jgi:hypothetical protein
LRDGFSLAYETPVGGAPWSIPFEFPIYQVVAAAFSALLRAPLGDVGRCLSWLFLLGCVPAAFATARRLELDRSVWLIFVCLLFSSPIYLFWGRTFLIETAAVFFSMAALPFAINLIRGDSRLVTVSGATLFLTLAMLQKTPTAAPAALVVGLCWLFVRMRRDRNPFKLKAREVAAIAVALGVPLAVTLAWTRYADVVRSHNPLGSYFSVGAVEAWQSGTFGQFFSRSMFVDVIWHRVLSASAGGWLGVLCLGAGIVARDPRTRRLIVLCLILFILPLVVLTNVHVIHTYYQTSCALFVSAALAIAIGTAIPQLPQLRLVVPAVTALIMASNYVHFRDGYWRVVNKPIPMLETRTLAVGEILKRYTAPDSAIVVFGFDWNSELAYYAERKSFTVPKWFARRDEAWRNPDAFLGGLQLGAIATCPLMNGLAPEQVLRRFEAEPEWLLVDVLGCQVLLKRVRS